MTTNKNTPADEGAAAARRDNASKPAPAFTPGPWRLTEPQAPDYYATIHGDGGKVLVAEAETAFGARDANARLIAAAPELYAALHNAERLIDACMDRNSAPSPDSPWLRELLDETRAALARASGEGGA